MVSTKLGHFKEESVATEIHNYLLKLDLEQIEDLIAYASYKQDKLV
jgi:hypothetical protein